MTIHPPARRSLLLGTCLLTLGVIIGAFGAHGLSSMIGPGRAVTFETGVRYHFYHAFGIIIIGIIQQLFETLKLSGSFFSFLAGILFFSFNCYLYSITGIKIFAMLVPIGGVFFIIGWVMLFINLLKLR